MQRMPLDELDGRAFDVAIVGAGVSGISAAQHLAAEGYSVLIVDKGDFASGASSRSSRLLHCGLRFLEPGEGLGYREPSVWEPLFRPRNFLRNLGRARDAMAARTELSTTMPERLHGFTFCFPVYEDGPYSPWHVGLGLRLVASLAPKGGVPLGTARLSAAEASKTPLLEWLREPAKLRCVQTWREFRYEWPERIALDTILDAVRMGALARNHTPVTGLDRAGGGWRVTLGDGFEVGAAAVVEAKCVLNTAGVWTDRVNGLGSASAGRKILGTKGCHVMVRLPPECAPYGVCTHTTGREPFYLIPWRGMHYAGPTDTAFEGDIDDVKATEAEIEHLIHEIDHLLPGAGVKRADVLFSWAGVRPLTYDADEPMGKRGHTLHDLAADGLPGAFAMTSSPIQSHRFAGRQLSAAVGRRIAPSGARQEISYAAKPFPEDVDSPALLNHWGGVTLSDLRHAAEREQPMTLVDLLFRRVGAGWTETMAREGAQKAAETVADILGWDEARIDAEVEAYRAHIVHLHGVGGEG